MSGANDRHDRGRNGRTGAARGAPQLTLQNDLVENNETNTFSRMFRGFLDST